ncbi:MULTISPECIES: peptidoglycan recognition protein [unclassified Streptomyces]|uniref:peptidoglycan recognition protein family protein n=1 Tax=unclassified Streptomyces TaxID=2593676 RepID=UPI000AC926F5|nr:MULTISPECIES: peptidoglycan recognition protein [unclassified Streptomyces]
MFRIEGMRGYLVSSIGVTCAAALTLPLAPTAATAAASPSQTVSTTARGAASGAVPDSTAPGAVPGSTQSLALAPLSRTRAGAGAGVQGLTRREVRPFSLLGVVWDDPRAALHGTVQVRTRATGTHQWSDWQEVETHNDDHAADPGTAESRSGRVRGATAPLWVGDSDGVEVRVRPAQPGEAGTDGRTAAGGSADATDPDPTAWELPGGLRLELVDPGEPPATDTGTGTGTGTGTRTDAAPAPVPALGPVSADRPPVLDARTAETAAANAELAAPEATVIPALSKEETEAAYAAGLPDSADGTRAKPYIGPRPSITTRRGWGADEGIRKGGFTYTKKVKAAFVHHTATGNNYTCAQAPSVIRGIYRYHVLSNGWRDIGYNFLVDKCGKIYEGRAGGVAKPVMGAHTLGFNTDSTGIAVLGTYSSKKPSAAAVKAIARLTAWKLGLYGVNPKGKTYLTSGGGNLYAKGRKVRLHTISGHRDGFATSCPGKRLYAKLGSARSTSAGYQGR